MKKISVIIPLFNESKRTVLQLCHQLLNHPFFEVIFISSLDDKTKCIENYRKIILQDYESCDFILSEVDFKGRSKQMNHGASIANSDILLFLHADSTFDINKLHQEILNFTLNIKSKSSEHFYFWGRFDIRLINHSLLAQKCSRYYHHTLFIIIAFLINLRSRLTSIATGDQGIFISKPLYNELNGYKNIPLMEDVEICRRLRKIVKPCNSKYKIGTSARRWQQHGIFKTICLMWKIRFLYWQGECPEKLVKMYRDAR